MKTFLSLMFVITAIIFFCQIAGCGPATADPIQTANINQTEIRKELLAAQYQNITSIENEITKIRDGCGADMGRWNANTIALYKKWQDELTSRYQEREQLVRRLSGDTLSGLPGAQR
jgi:hypothetical protein